ncbi:MAG: hypothetical protein QY307_08225 [Acidimicrobiia bacterium]|nr:MAG: hypothetical protein QY307_08225 [Acidimicrobiia bacterium]
MRRLGRLLLAIAMVVVVGVPQLALAQEDQEPVVDLMEFIPEQFRDDFTDRNGDGIPDIGELPPEGIAGIWDDKVGEVSEDGFLEAVSGDFDDADDGSSLTGPCKGVVISYDDKGNSVDAMFDRGGPDPLYDVYGNQKMTRSNPLKVDTRGVLVYYGSSIPETFHDHRWFLKAEGVFQDDGGDPNPRDKNRNAGSVDFGDLLPFSFTALIKAKGAWVDQWGAAELPEMESYPEPNCVGEGWVQFVGPNPLSTPPGILALMLAAAGFTGVLFNARPALSWRE